MILIDCPAVKSSSHISAHCGECETWHIIAREERSGFQGALLATTHAYDDLDRLAADGSVAYTYDAAGNRMTRTENGETIAYTLGVGDRLASWTGGSYTYNAAGCVTRIERDGRPTLDLTWNGQYQLVSVSTNGVFAESYAYDALGRRVSTTTLEGTVRHVYDDSWQCLADIGENGNVLRSYVWGEGIDNLLAVKIGGESYYPLTDIQGTVWGYADSANNIVARWTYDAWGNVLSESCSVPSLVFVRYRFQGRERSATTGLTNFRMRWYDPETGRWLSTDPIGLSGGLNLYVFCENDSVNGQDSLGTDRYITQLGLCNLHVAVAVDTWEKKNGKWKNTGTRSFSYGATGDTFSLNTVRCLLMNGEAEIRESNGNVLHDFKRIPSCPEQDLEMIDKIRSEMGWPSFYNLFNRKVFGGIFCLGDNCITWSERVIKYGM